MVAVEVSKPADGGGTVAGLPVVIRCKGGLGRAGTIGACTLVELGMTADEALATVKRERGPRAPETRAQEGFVRQYERYRVSRS